LSTQAASRAGVRRPDTRRRISDAPSITSSSSIVSRRLITSTVFMAALSGSLFPVMKQ